MVLTLDPILVTVGPLTARWLGVFWLVAALLTATLWVRDLRRRQIAPQVTAGLLSWIVPGALLGARVFHVLSQVDHYAVHPLEAVGVARGGFALWGAIVGGGLAAAIAARRRGLPLAPLADAAAPWLALGEAIGRVGCLIDGSNAGTPTGSPWGIVYADPDSQAPDPLTPRHPAPGYHALWAAVTVLLVRHIDATAAPGGRFAAWLALHATARLAIGFVRLDPPFLLGWQQDQWIAILALAALASGMIRARRQPAAGTPTAGP